MKRIGWLVVVIGLLITCGAGVAEAQDAVDYAAREASNPAVAGFCGGELGGMAFVGLLLLGAVLLGLLIGNL